MLFTAEDEVKVTEPPEQKVVAPEAVIVGAAGAPGSVIVADTVFEAQPLLKVKLYVPAASEESVKGSVVAGAEPEVVPDQVTVPVPVPVISIEPFVPEQAVGFEIVPKAIVGAVFTVTTVAAEEEVHPAVVTSTE